MVEKKNNKHFERVLSYFPPGISAAVLSYLEKKHTDSGDVNEIRLRAYGPVSLVISGENLALDIIAGKGAIAEIFRRICDGAVYAHRDDISRGFVTLDGGVRVGVAGHAHYDGGGMVGIGEASALVFRIPSGECSFANRLYREWLTIEGGMLICSKAGEGKTTAIRSLARLIGSGRRAKRVVVVDERCEFDPEAYSSAQVDILRGYRRSIGVDIAIRTMSAEVLIVDEISSVDDSRAMISALGAGVDVIATAHADSFDSLLRCEYALSLVKGKLFRSVCIIKKSCDGFSFLMHPIDFDKIKT